MIPLRALAPFAAFDASSATPRCELCSGPLGDRHRHVVELGVRGVQCACGPCGILFERSEGKARYRTVPDRVRVDPQFALTRERWAALGVPVALAFCYRDSVLGRGLVCYPGPAGITDAELEPDVWDAIAAASALVRELEDDVEALLVRGRRESSTLAVYLVPISTAFELAGRLRASWQGFSGGQEADAELAAFFAELDAKGRKK